MSFLLKPFMIVYATREGQTLRIAEHIAQTLQKHGASAQLVDAADPGRELDLAHFGLVILAASVHMQRHERELVAFVKKHRAALLDMPTLFLSVSLSEAAVENKENSDEHRARAQAGVEQMIERFFAATDFRPSAYKAVAGALVYSEYNRLVRLIMKRIAKAEGASTDTTRDYEYTDWMSLDQLVEGVLTDPHLTDAHNSQSSIKHSGLHIEGTVRPGFEPVRTAFIENFTQRGELGGACCIVQDGETVVDLWGGVTSREQREPWQPDTMGILHSTTKGLAAMVMALAHSRGWLDYDARVASYWPDFAQQGKGEITVRQLLAHQAGLFGFTERVDRAVVTDLDQLAQIMARQRPEWAAGERQAYHAITLGFYENELIRRVDPAHRTLGQVFDQEIARPLGLDAYIRVPQTLPPERIARLEPLSLWERLSAMPLSLTLRALDRRSVLHRSLVANPGTDFYLDPELVVARELEVPSGGGVASARALAKAYGTFATGGRALALTRETIAALEAEAIASEHGFFDECFGGPARFSLGFMKPNASVGFGHPGAFGAPGFGGSMGYADPALRLGYGYVTSRMGAHLQGDPRDLALRNAIPDGVR